MIYTVYSRRLPRAKPPTINHTTIDKNLTIYQLGARVCTRRFSIIIFSSPLIYRVTNGGAVLAARALLLINRTFIYHVYLRHHRPYQHSPPIARPVWHGIRFRANR